MKVYLIRHGETHWNTLNKLQSFTDNELNAIVSTEPKLNINQDRIDNAKQNFSNEYKHVCLGISASGPTKRWDINNFIKLVMNYYYNITLSNSQIIRLLNY